MNERLEATIICCARLSEGTTPSRVADDFIKKVELTTGLTYSGMTRIGVFVKLHDALRSHGDASKALIEAGL
jgi:hypothetical protein